MSKPTEISPHHDAVNNYLTEMLDDSAETSDALKSIASIQQAILKAHEKEKDVLKNWRDHTFEALIFNVQGLNIAIPLHELNAVHIYPEAKLPKLPGKPAHYIGILSHQTYRSQIIDTAQVILPNGFQHDNLAPKYIVLIDDYKWGLTCNDINKVITLTPEHISWRKTTGKRPWLAGTILSQMCSILNVDNLSQQLKK
jgi:purine-binding chemotaxis protein CheW